MKRIEQRFRDYAVLREKGFLIQEAAKELNISRQTAGRYEKRIKLRTEHYDIMIDRTKVFYLGRVNDPNVTTGELVQLADTLTKLISCRNKGV